MTDIDIPTLKAAALAATPGPWMRIVKGEQFPMVAITGPNLRIGSKTATYSRPMGDMEFIALANPATILALIERLERAEAVAEYARSREIPTTEKQVKAAEMFFTAPMMARLEKLEAVAEAASPFASSNAGGLEARLAQALAALEAP